MMEADLTDEVIRRFFLGDLDEAEREGVEEAFISDAEAKTRILMAEDDLIEDYLEDSLSPTEKEKFHLHYLSAPQQQSKLRIAKSLKAYVTAQAGASVAAASQTNGTTSRWRSLFGPKGRRRFFFIPITAFLAIAIAAGAIWQLQLRRLRLAQENTRRQAIEQELRKVNTEAHSPKQILSLALSPVTVRSLRATAEVDGSTKAEIVELGLIWTEKDEYSGYQARLQKVGAADQFTIPDLHVVNKPEGKTVLLKIPLRILTRGVYQVLLTGIGPDGKPGSSQEYTFAMTGGSTTGS